MLNCAEFFEYAVTQTAFLAYYPHFRAAVCAKADALTVHIEDGQPTRAVLRLAAALMAFQASVGAILRAPAASPALRRMSQKDCCLLDRGRVFLGF